MNVKRILASPVAAVMLLVSGAAGAALVDGISDASRNTSVFISVVERNVTNQVLRNLVIDTGARTLATFGLAPWSTTPAQETAILAFVASSTGTVSFNVGGGLNDQSFSTDLYGFLTSGVAAGPGSADYAQLGSAVTNIDTFIADANQGTFSGAGVLAANSAIDPGWHVDAWDSTVGGAIELSNEILFGQGSQLIGWKTAAGSFEIIRSQLGFVTSNGGTGDISYTAVPLPGVAWLLAPAFGLLAPWVRRRPATA